MVVQTVASLRYNDLDALEKFLEKLFGNQVWSVTVRLPLICASSTMYLTLVSGEEGRLSLKFQGNYVEFVAPLLQYSTANTH